MPKGNHRYVSEVVRHILTLKYASGGSAADCGVDLEVESSSSKSLSERPYRPVWCSCCCSCCVDEWLAAAPAGVEFLLESHCGARAYTLAIAQLWNKLQKSASSYPGCASAAAVLLIWHEVICLTFAQKAVA